MGVETCLISEESFLQSPQSESEMSPNENLESDKKKGVDPVHGMTVFEVADVQSQSFILNSGTRQGCVESLTRRSLHCRRETRQCPMSPRLGEPRSLSGRFGKEKYFLSMPGMEPQFLDYPAYGLVTVGYLNATQLV